MRALFWSHHSALATMRVRCSAQMVSLGDLESADLGSIYDQNRSKLVQPWGLLYIFVLCAVTLHTRTALLYHGLHVHAPHTTATRTGWVTGCVTIYVTHRVTHACRLRLRCTLVPAVLVWVHAFTLPHVYLHGHRCCRSIVFVAHSTTVLGYVTPRSPFTRLRHTGARLHTPHFAYTVVRIWLRACRSHRLPHYTRTHRILYALPRAHGCHTFTHTGYTAVRCRYTFFTTCHPPVRTPYRLHVA